MTLKTAVSHKLLTCQFYHYLFLIIHIIKKSLKISKGSSESVNRRRTDNTMAKEKVQNDKKPPTKLTHKTKDRVPRTQQKPGVNSGAPEG